MGDRTGFAWKQPPAYNQIDELVAAKWQADEDPAVATLCTDAEFIRRVYLDLTGLPPTADEVRAFLADTRDDRRSSATSWSTSSIGSHDYVEHWTNKWADLLQVNRKFLGVEGAVALPQVDPRARSPTNTPYDQFVHDDPDGERLEPRATRRPSYFKILREPDGDDGEHDAAVPGRPVQLQQVPRPPVRALDPGPVLPDGRLLRPGRPQGRPGERAARRSAAPPSRRAKPLFEIVSDTADGEVDARPDRAGRRRRSSRSTADHETPDDGDPRASELAAWITSKDNPYFARSYVNRLWGYLLGVGIIEPIDDIRAGNPPTNPELLDYLTEEFIKSGFDVRHVMQADLQVADVPALGRDQQVERGRQDQLLARDRPAAAGRGAATTRSTG